MNQNTLQTTWGCLLRSVEPLLFRAGKLPEGGAAPWLADTLGGSLPEGALACAAVHPDAPPATVSLDSPASLACFAERLASAGHGTAAGGASQRNASEAPLKPIFTHMRGCQPGRALPLLRREAALCELTGSGAKGTPDTYRILLDRLEAGLKAMTFGEEQTNALLSLLEACTGNVPFAPGSAENGDLSLYDHGKLCAAAGACLSVYLADRGGLRETEPDGEKVFLLYSADFSGIQKFIYTVSTANALRSLRSRSFFLELAMEHYIDELLAGCGVSRANLLYSGGGHCYILLPNTPAVEETLRRWNLRFNDWLLEQFGVSLYLADGWTACSANDLTNRPAETAPYKAMFRRVSSAVAARKLCRYSAGQIRKLNRPRHQNGERECRVCGRSDKLKGDRCVWCGLFEELSRSILTRRVILVSRNGKQDGDAIPLPALDGEVWLTFTDKKAALAAQRTGDVLRAYTKNMDCPGLYRAVRLYVGDYAADNSMEKLAEGSEGVRRLGVCRMDVDNLGQAFVSGFEQQDGKTDTEKQKYVTIARTAAFSRQMSLFFKGCINQLLEKPEPDGHKLQVTIVYSGGDDVFLLGAWTDVITAACRIHDEFTAFTCGTLTISGGVGLFDDHYPIRLTAAQAGELEDASKELPGKDGVTLFAPEGGYTYHWAEFEDRVLGEKEKELYRFFKEEAPEEQKRGNAFLYRLLELLRSAGEQEQGTSGRRPLQLARYAYLLARLEPKGGAAKASYRQFSEKMYRWALDAEDRRQLITAIYLFVYRNRKEK